jgi:hypothetical protein
VRYIGAWDLVLDPLGRTAYSLAQKGRIWMARRRHGLGNAGAGAATGADEGDAA